ncbi:MAG TPA: ribonuclease Y [Dissulfurispiraceae bacterium]|nr:ribonuclease Y [Dissulfurispiraceae bacterium]
MDDYILYVVIAIAVGLASGVISFLIYRSTLKTQRDDVQKFRETMIEEARKEADTIRKEASVSAKDLAYQLKIDAEKDLKERSREINRLENRLRQKEEQLEKKIEQSERREQDFTRREKDFSVRERGLLDKENHLAELSREQMQVLERLSSMRTEEAKQELFRRVEEESRFDVAKLSKRIEDDARESAEKKAKEIISFAIQRYSSDFVADATISAITLPSDEMKGRIIGREGRNIRAFEAATGVDLLVDDTPEVVTLSGFDPVRREIARLSLAKLVHDGRIHPARIEEVVEKVRKEVETTIREEGEKAVFDLGLSGVHPDLIRIIGRLRYRTSYGQNILQHSKEVAYLAGMMAAELGVDERLARRSGLLHDIGKAVDHEVEGSHQEIGGTLAKKFSENEYVINAIVSHHGEVDPNCVESALVAAADALSAARPGVRKESIENYLKRLEKLEELAMAFNGVEKCFAIQAGREVRILVKPEQINDDMSAMIARDLSKKIEAELTYPGQIKVTVIRESRFVDYAK